MSMRWLLALIVGCAPTGFPPDAVAVLRDGVDHMAAEQQAHADTVRSAPSAEVILGVESNHDVHVDRDFREIRAVLDRLAVTCILANRYPIDTGPMHDALQDVRLEYELHDIRIRTSTDRAAMLDEEARHSMAMIDAIAALRAQRDLLFSHESDAENCR